MAGVRQMGSANTASSQEAYWARYYPKQTVAPEKTAKQLKKEMLGFLVLGKGPRSISYHARLLFMVIYVFAPPASCTGWI